MKTNIKTEVKTMEIDIVTYIADDGKKFDSAKECELYECNIKREYLKLQLGKITTCKDINVQAPVDSNEHYESHDYIWYLPKTQAEADVINEYYNLEYSISPDEIGDWICVEAYDIEVPGESTYVYSIKESINYVLKFFNGLGYEISISKIEQ